MKDTVLLKSGEPIVVLVCGIRGKEVVDFTHPSHVRYVKVLSSEYHLLCVAELQATFIGIHDGGKKMVQIIHGDSGIGLLELECDPPACEDYDWGIIGMVHLACRCKRERVYLDLLVEHLLDHALYLHRRRHLNSLFRWYE